MKTYVSFQKDIIKYSDIITNLSENDELTSLYSDNEEQLSLDLYSVLSQLKCRVNHYKISDDTIYRNLDIAYFIGSIKDLQPVILSDESTLKYFASKTEQSVPNDKLTKNNSKAKRAKTKASKLNDQLGQLSLSFDEPLSDTIMQDDSSPNSVISDEDLFEQEYAKLIALFDSVTCDDFNPVKNMSSIINATKASVIDSIPFSDSVNSFCPEHIVIKVLHYFSGKALDELFDIVKNLHDEI